MMVAWCEMICQSEIKPIKIMKMSRILFPTKLAYATIRSAEITKSVNLYSVPFASPTLCDFGYITKVFGLLFSSLIPENKALSPWYLTGYSRGSNYLIKDFQINVVSYCF